MSIQILNEQTILKIAAGEVIENPASVVKELVENAIDAKATQIAVEVHNGGKSIIRVTDNGEGIPKDEIDLAFTRHATSKVQNYEDLFRIETMGFRGEALASIRAVSTVTVLSKQPQDEIGAFVKYDDPKDPLRQNIAHNTGTTVIVEDLFGRVPVRAGFMKSALAEANRITDLLYRFAVANPLISFKYSKDDKILLRTSGSSPADAIVELFGTDVSDQLIPVDFQDHGLKVYGWIGKTSLYRGNRSMQYLFANQRIIQEPSLVQIIEAEYSGKIPHGRYPIFFLWVEVAPDQVDVNIHPTKQRVQWVKEQVFAPMKDEVRRLLLTENEKNRLPEKTEEAKPERVNLFTMDEYRAMKGMQSTKRKDAVSDPKIDYRTLQEATMPQRTPQVRKVPPVQQTMPLPISKEEKADDWFLQLRYIGTIAKTYLLFEDAVRMEMVLLDQHAAHERILYDSFIKKGKGTSLQTQMLLVPQTLRIKPQEEELLVRNLSLLEELGFIAESIGESMFAIRGIPYQFGRLQSPQNLFYSLIDTLHKETKLPEQDIKDRLIKRACTEAVKAGENLHEWSVDELMKALSTTEHPHTCPHGRPTYVRVPLRNMHKWFQRIPS